LSPKRWYLSTRIRQSVTNEKTKILIFTVVKKLKLHVRATGKINIIASKIIYWVPKLTQLKR